MRMGWSVNPLTNIRPRLTEREPGSGCSQPAIGRNRGKRNAQSEKVTASLPGDDVQNASGSSPTVRSGVTRQ